MIEYADVFRRTRMGKILFVSNISVKISHLFFNLNLKINYPIKYEFGNSREKCKKNRKRKSQEILDLFSRIFPLNKNSCGIFNENFDFLL